MEVSFAVKYLRALRSEPYVIVEIWDSYPKQTKRQWLTQCLTRSHINSNGHVLGTDSK